MNHVNTHTKLVSALVTQVLKVQLIVMLLINMGRIRALKENKNVLSALQEDVKVLVTGLDIAVNALLLLLLLPNAL